jgi:hypothetical protein
MFFQEIFFRPWSTPGGFFLQILFQPARVYMPIAPTKDKRIQRWMVIPLSEAHSSDAMKNLVKFIICLAILATVIALAAYFLVILPGQALTPPTNGCTYHHTIFGDWLTCT